MGLELEFRFRSLRFFCHRSIPNLDSSNHIRIQTEMAATPPSLVPHFMKKKIVYTFVKTRARPRGIAEEIKH